MITNILIPTDFSSASWKATQVGIELANLNRNARLSILHVYPGDATSEDEVDFPPKIDQVKSKMNELTKSLIDQSEDMIDNVVLAGNINETMLNFIDDNDFDLVIIGINSNGFDNRLGSHAIKIIEESKTPVMIVPNTSPSYGSIT